MALKKRQSEALELLKQGFNVFLSGEAGTGKSFVIDQFKQYLDKNKIKYVVCAPTGLAAINVEGATLHRTFKLSTDLGDGTVDMKNVEEAKVIIIDEISMCRRDIFQYIARALFEFENPIEEFDIKREVRACRKKQIVVVGDFFQLPPVLGNNDKKIIEQMKKQDSEAYKDLISLEEKNYAFQCEEWDRFNFKNVVLNEVVRQSDKEYIDNLNKVRRGDSEGLEFIKKESSNKEIKNAIYLTSKNKDADNLNQNNLDKIKNKEYTFYAEEEGEISEADKPVPKYLKFKVGARVMSVVNITEKDKEDDVAVVNGMCGTVIKLSNDDVTVEFDNGYIHKFEKYKWSVKGFEERTVNEDGKSVKKMVMAEVGSYRQIPLKLAWAITIHKSQGQTYEEVNLNPNCFCEGQLYVALSRAKDLKKLYLTNPIRKKDLQTSKVVKEFYNKIEQNQIEYEEMLGEADSNQEIATTIEEFTEAQEQEEIIEEYISIQVPKRLENEVLELLKGNGNSKVDNEEIKALKRQIEDLRAQLERAEISAKRRPKVSEEVEKEVIRLRNNGLSMRTVANMTGIASGTVHRICKDNEHLIKNKK